VKKVPARTAWRSSTKRTGTNKGPIAVPKRKVVQLEALEDKTEPAVKNAD
jgi:cell division protease FtsH